MNNTSILACYRIFLLQVELDQAWGGGRRYGSDDTYDASWNRTDPFVDIGKIGVDYESKAVSLAMGCIGMDFPLKLGRPSCYEVIALT